MNLSTDIFFSEFTLESPFFWNSQTTSKTRVGVLLRIQFDRRRIGYANYNPWPELGDETAQDGLKGLMSGQLTPLLNQAFYWAEVDANARTERINLRESLRSLKNHQLITDVEEAVLDPKFEIYKIKMGRDLKKETEFLIKNLSPYSKYRLDFNGGFNFSDFYSWWSQLPPKLQNQIDFVEDPFDPQTCPDKNIIENSLWAWDFHQNKVSNPKTVIVKPTRQQKPAASTARRIYTHAFDHPLGVIVSHYAASQSQNADRETHGLIYKDVVCSDSSEKQMFEKNNGTGFGFDRILMGAKWRRL